MFRPLNRRTVLRGAGTALALPFLEAMLPRSARAAPTKPLRLLGWYFPNGYYHVNGIDDWTPKTTGAGFALSPILAPLMPVASQVSVLSGVANPPADAANLSCAHARGTGSFLTCVAPASGSSDGVSMDQVAASQLKAYTRFASLELGTDTVGGDIPIRSTIAWADANTPLAKETRPAALFDRLFAADTMLTPAEIEKRKAYRKSVLDSVLVTANDLSNKLGKADRQKLDGYLSGVRDLELRIANQGSGPMCTPGTKPPATGDIRTQTKLLLDVLALAFQCDVTRVATFMFDRAGSDLAYPFLTANGAPINAGHHGTSHHHGAAANLAQLKEILLWQTQQLAYLLDKLNKMDEGGESVLYRSAVFYSSEIGDGDLHEQQNLPIVVAGSAGGALKPGSHTNFANKASKADLFITLLRAVGCTVDKFGGDGDVALSI
ncbi:MAG: DUF1552 domain-containing protein [Myxococcaceae bacterium]|nr:DUF1552 domain-containing protein [Myxococcaceae bacterium]